MISKFYQWLGEQDLNDLVFRHGAYQERHRCMIYFDTYIYGLFRGATDEQMMTASTDFGEVRKKKYSSKFESVYPDIVIQVEAGNTKVADVAHEIDVSPRTVLSWIQRGLIGGRIVEGGGLRGQDVWHVVV